MYFFHLTGGFFIKEYMGSFNFSVGAPVDANAKTITTWGFSIVTNQTLTGSNTTVATPLFHIIGSVLILALYGVVTTDLGANHTASAYRINDQTAQVYLTAVAGTDISAIKAGSLIVKKGVVATAISKVDNVAGAILEPTTLETNLFTPVLVTKKTGATTDIEYRYTTTDAPTSGAIQHVVYYLPISQDGALTVI
jgi:hypothetical protein